MCAGKQLTVLGQSIRIKNMGPEWRGHEGLCVYGGRGWSWWGLETGVQNQGLLLYDVLSELLEKGQYIDQDYVKYQETNIIIMYFLLWLSLFPESLIDNCLNLHGIHRNL